MAVERIMSFAGLVLMAMLLPLVITSGRYVILEPGNPPDEPLYEGDSVHIFANKVHPLENYCEHYPYFDYPFCPPAEPITDRKKTLEELLEGDCFTLTQYELKFKEDSDKKILCEKSLTKDEVGKFRDAIKREFEYQIAYNKKILHGMVGRIEEVEDGSIISNPKYYLITHIHFFIKYSENQVKDISIMSDYTFDVDITKVAHEIKVNFTYSVHWDEIIPHKTHLSLNYTLFDEDQMAKENNGIWNSSLIFWGYVTLIWVGLLLLVTLPYLLSYSTRYSYKEEEQSDIGVTSPGHVHGEACKCPPYTSLLGAILGNGIQLFITICIFFILAYKRFLYTCNIRAFSSQILRTYCFTSVVAGSKASAFHGGFTPVGWKECIFQAGVVYFIPAMSSALITNVLAITKFGTSEVPELGIIYENLAVWGLVTGILLILSGILAHCSGPESQLPCATRKLPRDTRQQSWYMRTPGQMLLGGLLPFIVMFPEMDNIYASLWNLKLCGAFRTMLTSFIAVIIMTVMLAIGFTSSQLSKHDHQWWWRSVLRGGSPAIFMFVYGIYFFSRIDAIEQPLMLRILGYNFCACYAFFLILGTISFYASSFVFHCTYHLQKNE